MSAIHPTAAARAAKIVDLPRRTLWLYALPTFGTTAMHWLIMVFLLKYATDTLGIAPAMVGVLFAAGRFWDAISDPLAGWFSDRTRSRLGRRRPWMLAAALPLGLSFWALWSAPAALTTSQSGLWLAGSVLLFYTAQTAVGIPYMALGAELTDDHHTRTRIAAFRVGAEAAGIFFAIGCLHLVENAASVPAMASSVAAVIAFATVVLIVIAASGLRERFQQSAVPSERPLRALLDVVSNPHARRLTLGIMFTEIGLGSLLVAIPFATEQFSEAGTSAQHILGFVIPFVLSVPLWIPLGRRFGKSRCYAAANALCAVSFVAIGVFGYGSGIALIPLLGIGVSQAALRTFPDSIKADVIDWDEAETGERKEGAYFAAWNLAEKFAGVASVALVGFFIQGEGAAVDPEGIRLVVSYVPAAFMVMAMVALRGFRLDADAHADLRRRIGRDVGSPEAGETTGALSSSGA